MTVKSSAVTLKGGLDQSSSQLAIDPGRVVDSKNYYALPKGGYRRMDGYSKYSGGWQLPSSEDYSQLQILVMDVAFPNSYGNIGFVGSQSNAIGYPANKHDPVALDDGNFILALTKTTGTFIEGDIINAEESSGGEFIGNVISVGTPDIEGIDELIAKAIADSYQPRSVNDTRTETPDPIEGVKALHMFKGYVFAVRQLGYEDGLFVTSSWAFGVAGTSTGEWIPMFPYTDPRLVSQGNYEFVNYNFKGHEHDQVMFGVNGKNKAFFIDGSPGTYPQLTYITTGMLDDKPTHIAAFKNHLFLSFPGGSLQHSSIDDYETWSPITGAAELTTGEDITALKVLPGNALGIFCKTKILILRGTSTDDWQLEDHTDAIGAIAGTAQNMPMTLFADERGITALSAAQEYGDFSSSMISHDFDTLYRKTIRNFIASSVSKEKSQYRLFASDGTAIYLTFDRNQPVGAMLIDLGIGVGCACSGEDVDGNERSFFGGDDGYVYELDKGINFSGNEIEHWLRLPFNHLGSPRQKKRFRRLALDINSESNARLYMRPEFAYGSEHKADHRVADIQINEGVKIFESDEDAFTYDYDPISDGDVFIAGTGVNIGLTIYGKSSVETPHTLYSIIYNYSPRALKR